MRSAVVFPHPEGPSSTMNSPSSTARSRPSTATTSPSNRLVTFSNVTLATQDPPTARVRRAIRRYGPATS